MKTIGEIIASNVEVREATTAFMSGSELSKEQKETLMFTIYHLGRLLNEKKVAKAINNLIPKANQSHQTAAAFACQVLAIDAVIVGAKTFEAMRDKSRIAPSQIN